MPIIIEKIRKEICLSSCTGLEGMFENSHIIFQTGNLHKLTTSWDKSQKSLNI